MSRRLNSLAMLSTSSTQGDQTSGSFNGAKIYFCHTSRTTLSTTFNDNYSGNTPTLMLSQSPLTMNWTAGAWNEIPLSTTFDYNSASNLLIEIQWTSSASSLLAASVNPPGQDALLGLSTDTVGAYYYQACFQLFYLNTNSPFFNLENTQVNSGDGLVDPGESIQIACRMKNTGLAATNLNVTLSCTSSWCSVTAPNWSAGNVATGATVSNNVSPYAVSINAGAPAGLTIPFKLNSSANSGVYTQEFTFNVTVAKPALSLASYTVNDMSGNANLALNPGERVQLIVALTNSGLYASNVTATLSSSNQYVSLVSTTASFGAISKLAKSSNANNPFCIQMATNAWTDGTYLFNLKVDFSSGSTTNLPFGVCGAYNTGTVSSASWLDTTGGTTLSLGDDAGVYVNIGFNFPYYGKIYSQIGVVDNGYLDIPTANIVANNTTLPNSGEPNGMIAPYWDDFNPTAGGVIRTKLFGTAPNRIFVVEWNGVPLYGISGALTFEVLLHESGKIVFQYGNMTGSSIYGTAATIGIENPEGTAGVQYSYNKANAVANGTSVTFDTTQPPLDSDGDGVPNALESIYSGTTTTLAPNADSDNDGMSNLKELYAGTNPYDSNSVLAITSSLQSGSTNFIVNWNSMPGQLYHLDSSTNLFGSWSNISPVAVTGAVSGNNQCTVNVGTAKSMYIRVSTP